MPAIGSGLQRPRTEQKQDVGCFESGQGFTRELATHSKEEEIPIQLHPSPRLESPRNPGQDAPLEMSGE
eukprot:2958887-Pyramimonas_sp.AAC.1